MKTDFLVIGSGIAGLNFALKAAAEQCVLLLVLPRKNMRKGFYRKKHLQQFRLRTYHCGEMVEAGFSSIKRKFRSSVSSRSVRTIRTEAYGRLACHNIFSHIMRLLGQSRIFQKPY